MLVGDLIYNDDFDFNCIYAIYEIKRESGKSWHDVEPIWSTLKNGFGKPPCELLDKNIEYITIDVINHTIVIEVEDDLIKEIR